MPEESPESPESEEAQASHEGGSTESTAHASPQTDIEHLQEVKAREGNQAAKEQALRQLLSVLDPHPQDQALAYEEVLGRLQNVLAREVQQAGG